jgi:hypothetical protein
VHVVVMNPWNMRLALENSTLRMHRTGGMWVTTLSHPLSEVTGISELILVLGGSILPRFTFIKNLE